MASVDRQPPKDPAVSEDLEQLVPEGPGPGDMLQHHDSVGQIDRPGRQGRLMKMAAMGFREMIAQGDRRIGLDADESPRLRGDRALERDIAIQAITTTDVQDGRPGPETSGIGQDHVVEDPVAPFTRAVSGDVRSPGLAWFPGHPSAICREAASSSSTP